jgi:hypothetical protein
LRILTFILALFVCEAALADCPFLTRPPQETTDGVTRLNYWPEVTLLCHKGAKLRCSPGGVWQAAGTGTCDAQEAAEREAATLEGTGPLSIPITSPSDSPPLGGPGSNAKTCAVPTPDGVIYVHPNNIFCGSEFCSEEGYKPIGTCAE